MELSKLLSDREQWITMYLLAQRRATSEWLLREIANRINRMNAKLRHRGLRIMQGD